MITRLLFLLGFSSLAYAQYSKYAQQGFVSSMLHSLQAGTLPSGPKIGNKGTCEYFWEEKPNYTDYTTYDQYLKRNHPFPDRTENETLQGSGVLATDDICANVPKLLPCFKRAWANDMNHHQNLKQWANENSYSINQVMLALAWRETRMGQLQDSCDDDGNCNGVGMVQVITIVGDDFQEDNSSQLPEWQGITHNLLTNLKYGLRVLDSKVNIAKNLGGTSLKQVSYYYNGSEDYAEDYSKVIVQNYEKLSKCGISFD